MKSPKISVIVPVYNTENYLCRCIESILEQSYTDFELLLVDDGSLDNSGTICDEYAAQNSHVRVIHKENGGVSSARNLGIAQASGEWVTFVDSDDWLDLRCLEMLTNQLDADMIKCGLEPSDKSSSWIFQDQKYDVKDFIERYEKEFIARTACVTLYMTDILKKHHIEFDESIRYGEDMIFNLSYLIHCESVRLVNYIGYIYYSDSNTKHITKYRLSFNDIEVSLKKALYFRAKIKEITKADVDFENDYNLYFSMIPIVEMKDEKFMSDYLLLCRKFIQSFDERYFYNNLCFSPIIRGIVELKIKYEEGLYVEAKELYDALNVISLHVDFIPTFQHKDFYLWFLLIKKNLFLFMDLLMKFYFYVKRLKSRLR